MVNEKTIVYNKKKKMVIMALGLEIKLQETFAVIGQG